MVRLLSTVPDKTLGATGVILAGGKSRRMKRDKLSLKIGGATLFERVHRALASRCEEIIVAGARGDVPVGTWRIPDLRPGHQGPLAGIEAGLLAAQHRSVFVAAGDMPFLTADLVGCLLGFLSDRSLAVVPDLDGPHPLCAAYGREVQHAVSAALDRGVRSVREVLEALPGVRYVGEKELRRLGDPNLLLTNVNSPEDLTWVRNVLREGVLPGGR
jgi:molybdopterin-guanine dinucleotide biosynthesis protein A